MSEIAAKDKISPNFIEFSFYDFKAMFSNKAKDQVKDQAKDQTDKTKDQVKDQIDKTKDQAKNQTDKKYYNLLINIRNYHVLGEEEINYLHTLSKKNLIEIIDIYNMHMININETA